jgi:Uncharacterized conserved protein
MVQACFHIDENSKWDLLLGNVTNLLHALDSDPFQIEVLANSEAVRLYVNDPQNRYLTRMTELAEKGVRFVACNNSLGKLGIAHGHLAAFVKVVPTGVLELVQRQDEGYAYIKP